MLDLPVHQSGNIAIYPCADTRINNTTSLCGIRMLVRFIQIQQDVSSCSGTSSILGGELFMELGKGFQRGQGNLMPIHLVQQLLTIVIVSPSITRVTDTVSDGEVELPVSKSRNAMMPRNLALVFTLLLGQHSVPTHCRCSRSIAGGRDSVPWSYGGYLSSVSSSRYTGSLCHFFRPVCCRFPRVGHASGGG